MNRPNQSLDILLGGLQPKLHEGVYVFASTPTNSDVSSLNPIATFRETEGLAVILEESRAIEFGIAILFRAAWITLEVQSDLAAVGLTAAVSTALAKESIPCNIIAAAHHVCTDRRWAAGAGGPARSPGKSRLLKAKRNSSRGMALPASRLPTLGTKKLDFPAVRL